MLLVCFHCRCLPQLSLAYLLRVLQEVRSMLKARKLGVHTPGARCSWPTWFEAAVGHAPMLWPAPSRPRLASVTVESTIHIRLLLPSPSLAAVVYHVDHGTSSIYMERVEGHSLKTLLHGGHLGGTGEQEGSSAVQLGF